MTESIVWAVVWGVLFFVGPGLIALIVAALFGGFGAAVHRRDRGVGAFGGAVVGQVVGCVLGIAFAIFAAVQCVLMIINAVNGV